MRTLSLNPFRIVLITSIVLTALAIGRAAPAAEPQEGSQQMLCADRPAVLTQLDGAYHERPTAMGLVHNGTVLEVLSSEDGSWTIIVTAPNGISCLLASGDYWQALPAPTAELSL